MARITEADNAAWEHKLVTSIARRNGSSMVFELDGPNHLRLQKAGHRISLDEKIEIVWTTIFKMLVCLCLAYKIAIDFAGGGGFANFTDPGRWLGKH
jgi:hypothetical protein